MISKKEESKDFHKNKIVFIIYQNLYKLNQIYKKSQLYLPSENNNIKEQKKTLITKKSQLFHQ
jgi:hypothetical protein